MTNFHFTSILFALLLSIRFLKSSFPSDTLLPNQSISIGQTLISPNQDFELGFFTSGKSPNQYLGIWYKNTPDVVVWVANRNDPISDPHGVTFAISGNGTLVISTAGKTIWSANPSGSGAVSNPVLQLLDTGNLVLVNHTMEGSSQRYIWQSFEYPTDTFLPDGMELINNSNSGVQKCLVSWRSWDDPSPGDYVYWIENEGLPEVVVYIWKKKIYRSGKWFKQEGLICLVGRSDSSIITRAIRDPSGSVHLYIMNTQNYKWSPLNCTSGDGLFDVREVIYPDMLLYWLNTSMSLKECQAKCLKNCSCTACANPYITNGGHGCVLWFGDLIDNLTTYIQKEKKKWPTRLMLMSFASGVIVSVFINGGVFIMTRRKRQERPSEDLELPLFKFATIFNAANNFSTENLIGEGGFGPVYKGVLSSGEEIAIKRLSTTSGQGLQEFKNEVTLISKLQHTNLVRLLGCCTDREERILIYEYLQNKSLDYFIFDQNRKKLLSWANRFNIVMGIAKGLLYLHHDSRLKIIHRDLKASNILLDGNFNPKISDFGLARTFGDHQPVERTRRVVGTFGYMSPEYLISGNYSVKSDIFSMGVVLLEIVSGKKNRGFESRGDHYHSLLGHAWMLWKEKKVLEIMDECLKDSFVESEVKRCIHVGLLCVQKLAEDRPVMSSMFFMLGTDGAILPEPKEPGFFIGTTSTQERNGTPPIQMTERNTITITDFEAR